MVHSNPLKRTDASQSEDTPPPSKAFEEELTSLLPALRSYARKLDFNDADDLFQETFAAVWGDWQSFQPGTNMKAWAFTIMRHRHLGQRRRSRFRGEFDQARAEARTIQGNQEASVQLREVEALLDRLTDKLRDSILSIRARGMSHKEFAQSRGISARTSRSRLSRANNALKELEKSNGRKKRTLYKEPLEIEKIKECILEHFRETKKWPTVSTGKVQYGPYAGRETWEAINNALSDGYRGLSGNSSLAKVKNEIRASLPPLSAPQPKTKPPLKVTDIEEAMISYRLEEGKWPTSHSGATVFSTLHGLNWKTVNVFLSKGRRGLPGGNNLEAIAKSLTSKNPELKVSRENKNEIYELEKIKECIRAHYEATGEWPISTSTKLVEYGPYAGKFRWRQVPQMLNRGDRGLPKGWTFPALKQSVRIALIGRAGIVPEHLEIDKIKECMVAHYRATGEWPSTDTDEYIQHGPYAGLFKWSYLPSCLNKGGRGLPKDYTFNSLRKEARKETIGVEGKRSKKNPLTLENIKACMRAHFEATGEWPKSGMPGYIQHGPYAGEIKWTWVGAYLAMGTRGLPKGVKFSQLIAQAQTELLGAPVEKIKMPRIGKKFLNAREMAARAKRPLAQCERLFENFAQQAETNGVIIFGDEKLSLAFKKRARGIQITADAVPAIAAFLCEPAA